MKANELRIGNKFEWDNQEWEVAEVGYNSVTAYRDNKGYCIPLMVIKAIPLTEEKLIKFGFIYDTNLKLWKNKDFAVRLQTHAHHIFRYLLPLNQPDKYYFISGASIQYVHELQNAWNVLMKNCEELTLKE